MRPPLIQRDYCEDAQRRRQELVAKEASKIRGYRELASKLGS